MVRFGFMARGTVRVDVMDMVRVSELLASD